MVSGYPLASPTSHPAAAGPSQAGPGWPAAAAPNLPRCPHAGTAGARGVSADGWTLPVPQFTSQSLMWASSVGCGDPRMQELPRDEPGAPALPCLHPACTLPSASYPGAVAEHGCHLVRAEEACGGVLDVREPGLGVAAIGLQSGDARRAQDAGTTAFLWVGHSKEGWPAGQGPPQAPHTHTPPMPPTPTARSTPELDRHTQCRAWRMQSLPRGPPGAYGYPHYPASGSG